MRGVRQVVRREDQRPWEAAVPLLVLVGVLFQLLEDLLVGVRRRDLPLDGRRIEVPLIFEEVELLLAGGRINDSDLFPFP